MNLSKILFASLSIAIFTASQAAKADGFICADQSGQFGIKLYDNVQPKLGTRSPAILIITDGSKEAGGKTLASFTPDQGDLHLAYGSYHATANFPSAYNQLLEGVKMSQIKELVFSVKHDFNRPLPANQKALAQLQIHDKSQNTTYVNFTCTRYLKD